MQADPGAVDREGDSAIALSICPAKYTVILADSLGQKTLASSLLAEMGAQSIQTTQIARWQSGAWESHLPGFPANDFPIEAGQGYFVRVASNGIWRPQMGAPVATPTPTAAPTP